MKNIAKKSLLISAFALLLSTVPVQAMEETMMVEETAPMPADVQQEVTTKRGFFANLTERARNFRLKNAMKELDRAWSPFIKCVSKGGQDCSKQARTVRTIIISILALIGIGSVAAIGRKVFGGRGKATVMPQANPDAVLMQQVNTFLDRPTFYNLSDIKRSLQTTDQYKMATLSRAQIALQNNLESIKDEKLKQDLQLNVLQVLNNALSPVPLTLDE